MSVDTDLNTVIAAAVATLTVGTNLFEGPVRRVSDYVPATAVFTHTSGGPAPQVYNDGGAGTNLNPHSTQIRVRYEADDFANGRTLADSVYSAVRKCTPSNTIGTMALQAAPYYLGQDDDKHHEWSINLRVWKRE